MVVRSALMYGMIGAAAFAALSYGCMAIDAKAGSIQPKRWYISAPEGDMIGDSYIQPIRDPETGCQYMLARTEHGVALTKRLGANPPGCN
jgi:hypothetical protein